MLDTLLEELNTTDKKIIKKKELQLSKRYFSPLNEKEKLKFMEECLKLDDFQLFSIATLGVKNTPSLLDESFMDFYENLLFRYVNTWSKCDQYCYRVLNPMMEHYPHYLDKALTWARTNSTYSKRASCVCMIHSSTEFSVHVDFDRIQSVCDILISDSHIHVQKGMGWLLKYCYVTYPEKTICYIRQNINLLTSVCFSYALEKMPVELKNSLREYKKQQKCLQK